MNRFRPAAAPHPFRLAIGAAAPAAPETGLGDDLRLFLTAWAGGLVFFGTFFG